MWYSSKFWFLFLCFIPRMKHPSFFRDGLTAYEICVHLQFPKLKLCLYYLFFPLKNDFLMLAYNNFCGVLCRKLLTDNYASITKKHFLRSKGSSGIDPFSRGLYMTAASGFVKDIPVTVPRSRQVRE